ncbi:hypothetical protein JQX13_34270 [Archangium violaceum]|uniref:hypothetical protein n=1 Tax=Archangium violaceum TaxID=83451 RepID=UPI00193C82E0|nr:hypothetical protein [Archangium violaceum]QRK05237.1 hypothetical protein JQX13_34270 [Archangium violaceum]
MNISEAYNLPSREDLTALGFVVRLDVPGQEEKRRLVDEYVFTPAVRQSLPVIFEGMRHALARGEPLGRFIHGSFGSGKSHFLSMLGMLLEDEPLAWGKQDALVRELEGQHRAWVRDAKLLTVRLHMLSEAGGSTFDRAIYEAFNRALARHGKPAFEFLHVQGVLDEARLEAERYGAAFWRHLEDAGVVGSQEDFEALATGTPEERESLARALLQFKGRDAASAGVDSNWGEGLRRLTAHAKQHGFGGVVFLVDEFLLWLSDKAVTEFKAAINQLTVMVDHSGGKRAVPVFAFIARQRNIQEFFPDLTYDHELHEHLRHHTKRFEETMLQDVELRHICRERILKPRKPEAVRAAVQQLSETQKKVLPVVLQGADVDYLKDVYPFHPALIEMLIDVSSLLQRERTALRLLYELLVLHNPTLELGKLLPVGRAFDALFPPSGVEAGKGADDLKAIHRLFYESFRPAMDALLRDAQESGGTFDERRRRVLEEIVKTVLLAEASPRLKGPGLTVRKLVLLNDSEVTGETDRSRMAMVAEDLLQLSRRVGALQLSGSGVEAVVSVVLRGANFGELLERARGRTGGEHTRYATFFSVFTEVLGLSKTSGFRELSEGQEGDFKVKWRGTQRRGSLKLCNVRLQPHAAFQPGPGDEFRILVDHPWDEAGHTVEEDRQRARDVTRRSGTAWTVCWLPRHLTPLEMGVLKDLAAVRFLLTSEGQEDLLANLSLTDRQSVLDRARTHESNLLRSFQETLKIAYKDHGQVEALAADVSTELTRPELAENLEQLGAALLARRYPQHPTFLSEPRVDDLQVLCDWMVQAHESGAPLPFNEQQGKVLKNLGGPLELVELGQTRGTLRRDTRYIKGVLEAATSETLMWGAVDQRLEENFGLPPSVRCFFLAFFARAYGYRVLEGAQGSPWEPRVESSVRANLKLVRAPLLSVAVWGQTLDLAKSLFELQRPGQRTLGEQDKLVNTLRQEGERRRGALLGVRERLVHLGVGGSPRVVEVDEAILRLKPLVTPGMEPHAQLEALLQAWAREKGDAARVVVQRAEEMQRALESLSDSLRSKLETVAGKVPQHEVSARACLRSLGELLGASELAKPLRKEAVEAWNREADAHLSRILDALASAQTREVVTPSGGASGSATPIQSVSSSQQQVSSDFGSAPGPMREVVLEGVRVRLGERAELDSLWASLQTRLAKLEPGVVEIDVVVRRK